MKKKVVGYLLCAAMVFSMTACGDNADQGSSSDSQSSQEESSDAPSVSDEQPDDGDVEQPDDGDAEQPDDGGEEEPEEVAAGPAVVRVEAEDFAGGEGIGAEGDHLGGLNTEAWAYYNVDLADGGYGQVAIRYGADSMGGTVTLWEGDEDYKEFGTELATVEFEGTGSWDMNSTLVFDVPDLAGKNGTVDLVVEWKSPEGESDYLMNPDWIEFYKVADAGAKTKSLNYFDIHDAEGAARGDTHIYVGNGAYAGYKLNFGDGGFEDLEFTGDFYGPTCSFEIHLGSPDGELLGSGSFDTPEEWNDAVITTNTQIVNVPFMKDLKGNQDVYLVITAGDYNFAGLRFLRPALKVSARVEAESRVEGDTSVDAGSEGNPVTDNNGNTGGTQEGKYNVYRLDFEDGGFNKVTVRYGTWDHQDGTIEFRYGSPDGDLIATMTIDSETEENIPSDAPEGFADGWTNWATYQLEVPELAELTGEQWICLVFHPRKDGGWVGNIDYYEFSK